MIGTGKYDKLCTLVRKRSRAKGAMVIIIEGDKGHGFSCQVNAEMLRLLPGVLRTMADQIEYDNTDITIREV